MRLKKTFLIMLTALLALSALLAAPPGARAEDKVIEISTAAELREIAANVNSGTNEYPNTIIRLTQDIDLGNTEWTPIGGYAHYKMYESGNGARSYVVKGLRATLDGQGHTIKGLSITTAPDKIYSLGLIGWGHAENLIVEGSINVTGVQRIIAAGGIVGRGTANNCVSRVNVNVGTGAKTTTTDGKTSYQFFTAYVGGVVGSGSARCCVAEGTVKGWADTATVVGEGGKTYTIGGTAYVGGIVGGNSNRPDPDLAPQYSSVYTCSYTGSAVTGSGYNAYVGGLAGMGSVQDSSIVGDVVKGSAPGNLYKGALAGELRNGVLFWAANYARAALKEASHNAIAGVTNDLVAAGAGLRPDGTWGELKGTGYYWQRSEASQLQPVILQFEAPGDGEECEIPYGEEKSLADLGVKIKWMYPENRSFKSVNTTQAITTNNWLYGNYHLNGVKVTWEYFKAVPDKIATLFQSAKGQIESALESIKIFHITDAYKKDYLYAEPVISVGVRGDEGTENASISSWFTLFLKRYYPTPTPVPEPVPDIPTPSNPSSEGWLSKSADLTVVDSNTYSISTPNQLAGLAARAKNDKFTGKTIILTKDIDLSGDKWIPIADYNYPFAGTFDGKGFTVKNMYCVSEVEGGLFDSIGTAGVVQNLHVEGIVSSDLGGVGGIVNINNGTVKDSSFAGKLSSQNGNWYGAGGIAFNNQGGTISNCTTNVEMTNSGDADNDAYGGIASANSGGTITGCTSNGTINVTTGTASNSASISVGGVVGSNCSSGTVKNSESRTSITTSGTQFAAVGGIAGLNGESESDASAIASCKSYGSLPAFDADKAGVGGIVGINDKAATVKDSGWLVGTAANFAGKNKGAEPVNTTTFTGSTSTDIVTFTGTNGDESASAATVEVAPTTKGVIAVKPQLLNISFINPSDISLDVTVSADMAGNIVADRDAIIGNMPSNIDTTSFDIVPLPLYITDISIPIITGEETSDDMPDTGLVAIETTLNSYAGQAPSKIVLMKALKDNDIRAFKWASSAAAVGDGEFFIAADAAGTAIEGNIVSGTKYYVFIGVKDNGNYDLDPAEGSILDPTVLGMSGTSPTPNGGGSGGGCSAGVTVLALIALTPFAFRRKK